MKIVVFIIVLLQLFVLLEATHSSCGGIGAVTLDTHTDQESDTEEYVLDTDILESSVLSLADCDPATTCIYQCTNGCNKWYAFDVAGLPGWHCGNLNFKHWLNQQIQMNLWRAGYQQYAFTSGIRVIFNDVWTTYKRICRGLSFALTTQNKAYIWNQMMANYYVQTNPNIKAAATSIFAEFYWRANHGVFNLCACPWSLGAYKSIADSYCASCQ
jgi:hypothetical protein